MENKDLQEQEVSRVDTGLSFELKSLIDADKAQLENISKYLVSQVADGYIDPVKAFLHNRKIHELAKMNEANLRPYFNDHANVAKGETSIQYNVKITQAETGVKYDYSACGDKIYDKIIKDLEELTEKKKERELFLKSVKSTTGVFDPETSEAWKVEPPIKSGTLGYKTELK